MPNEKRLHIIALDVPFPADYGGAVDMFYRIKALYKLGYELTIHIFEYGRGKQKELEKYGKVIYYKRSFSFLNLFSSIPFIVKTRKSPELLQNLLSDNVPIFFEGIHTTYYLTNPDIASRMTYVRMHNIEHAYYYDLAKGQHLFKKLFFRLESYKLKNYERILSHAKKVLAIKKEDQSHFLKYNPITEVLPASLPEFEIRISQTKNYALFHGNLSVQENEKAIYWIIDALKNKLTDKFPLLVAGKNPSDRLLKFCNSQNIEVISNPPENELDQLIAEAQIHIFHTEYPSGVKLKLLNALHSKGQILINDAMTNDDEIKGFCQVANSKNEYSLKFEVLKNRLLSNEEFNERINLLRNKFSTIENIKKVIL